MIAPQASSPPTTSASGHTPPTGASDGATYSVRWRVHSRSTRTPSRPEARRVVHAELMVAARKGESFDIAHGAPRGHVGRHGRQPGTRCLQLHRSKVGARLSPAPQEPRRRPRHRDAAPWLRSASDPGLRSYAARSEAGPSTRRRGRHLEHTEGSATGQVAQPSGGSRAGPSRSRSLANLPLFVRAARRLP